MSVIKPAILRNPDPYPLDIVSAAKAHAIAEFPKEAVGFVLPDRYVPATNIHTDPNNHFEIDPKDTAKALDAGALAIVHSHPNGGPSPSFHDQAKQIESGLVWGIVPVLGLNEGDEIHPQAGEITWWGDSLPIAPLERRRFIWGVFHCWSLYRDWMRVERGITLENIPCDREFVQDGTNVFLDNCERVGMVNMGKLDMNDLEVGDMLVGHIKGDLPNHCGVYLGGDDFMHHPPGGASGKANLLRWWPHIDTVLRYGATTNPARLR